MAEPTRKAGNAPEDDEGRSVAAPSVALPLPHYVKAAALFALLSESEQQRFLSDLLPAIWEAERVGSLTPVRAVLIAWLGVARSSQDEGLRARLQAFHSAAAQGASVEELSELLRA